MGETEPLRAVGQDDVKLIDAPNPDDDWRTLAIDVCIDSGGLVRRIAFSPTIGRRSEPGWLERLAKRLDKSPTPLPGIAGEGRPWDVIELWDYGCQAAISAPTELLHATVPPLRKVALELWRMRRQYKQAAPDPATDTTLK
jgi:hypothetical protein